MENMNMAKVLFACGNPEVRCIKSEKRKILSMFPSGLGKHSASTPASATKKPIKTNGLMVTMDKLFIDGSVNSVASEDTCYTEFVSDGNRYAATFDGQDLSFVDDIPNGYSVLAPIVMYAASDASPYPEFKERFAEAVEEFVSSKNQELSLTTAASLCDSFYYEVVKDMQDIKVYDKDLAPESIKQGYAQEMFDDLDVLVSLDLPQLSVLEGVAPHNKKTKGKSSKHSDFDSCRNGEHIISYEWDEEQKAKIPSLETLDSFIPCDVFDSVRRKIEIRTERVLNRMELGKTGLDALGTDYVNFSIVGKPGTGKTTIAYALGATLGMPVYTVALTKNTEEDTFQGMTKVVDGKFDFVTTDFLYAFEHGGIVVLEEINLADPAVVMGSIGQAIEAPFILMKNGYEAVRRHPMCIIISTMNIGTFGSKGVSQALSSRFKQTYCLNDPEEENFIAILENKGHEMKRCKWVYNAYQKICNYLKSPSVNQEELCLNVTLRGCLGALENMDEGDTPKESINNTLVGKIAESDLDLAENIKKDVVASLPNLSI